MDFDSLITLILTIVFILAGILGGKKKPRQQPASVTPADDSELDGEESSENAKSGVETLLDKYFNDSDQGETEQEELVFETVEEQEKNRQEEQAMESTISLKDDSNYILDKIEESQVGSDSVYSSGKMREPVYDYRKRQARRRRKKENVRKILNNFDGRKAVIYSEILNRKYF